MISPVHFFSGLTSGTHRSSNHFYLRINQVCLSLNEIFGDCAAYRNEDFAVFTSFDDVSIRMASHWIVFDCDIQSVACANGHSDSHD